MKRVYGGGVSPQQKLLSVNKKLGNLGIRGQQGTTRQIYDGILIDGQTLYRFFRDAKSKKFPFTNLNENRLAVGETMAVERAYFMVAIFNAAGSVLNLESAFFIDNNFTFGDLNFTIGTSEVIKPTKMTSFAATFNKNAPFDNYNNFEFDTQLVIPPLLEFESVLELPVGVAADATNDAFLFMVLEGVGSLIAPKATF